MSAQLISPYFVHSPSDSLRRTIDIRLSRLGDRALL